MKEVNRRLREGGQEGESSDWLGLVTWSLPQLGLLLLPSKWIRGLAFSWPPPPLIGLNRSRPRISDVLKANCKPFHYAQVHCSLNKRILSFNMPVGFSIMHINSLTTLHDIFFDILL